MSQPSPELRDKSIAELVQWIEERSAQPAADQKQLEQAALALFYHAAEMIKAGQTPEQVEREFVAQGVKPDTARNLMQRLGQSRTRVTQRAGQRNLMLGLLLIALGFAVMVRATHIPDWGAALLFAGLVGAMFGLVRALHGFRQMRVDD